jgi:hypothetical protein
MKFNELLNTIKSSTFEERQILIDALYAPKILTDSEQKAIKENDYKNLISKVKQNLEKNNLLVPNDLTFENLYELMTNYLTDFIDDLQEFENLTENLTDLEQLMQISLYFLSKN